MRHMIFALAGLAIPAAAFGAADLKITEIYEGVPGDDVTSDWIEITNFGDMTYTFGVDGNLYFDDSSADPTVNEPVTGITAIAPGESVIVMISDDSADVSVFYSTWGPNVAGVQVGYLAGVNAPGLGQGGEPIYLFDGNTIGANVVDTVSYLGNDNGIPGATWVYDPGAGSFNGTLQAVDGVYGAFTAPVAGGDLGEYPFVGSPGAVPTPGAAALLALAGIAGIRRRRA